MWWRQLLERFLFAQSKKRSGVEGLIEIENPNRVSQKSKKVTEIDVAAPRELSRRERWVPWLQHECLPILICALQRLFCLFLRKGSGITLSLLCVSVFQRGDRKAKIKGTLHEASS